MNDLSSQAGLQGFASQKPRVAVLVDGENISQSMAGQIIMKACGFGELIIRRVYGNAAKLPTWDAAPGFRMVHSGVGKNATDILLSIEAMDVMLNHKADVLIIAASDRDYTHLVVNLREAGHLVVGMGENKSPESYRKSCSKFMPLTAAVPVAKVSAPSIPTTLEEKVVDLIHTEGEAKSMVIGKLGGRMHGIHKVKIGSEPEKTWRAFLLARPKLFQCDARGADARVTLLTL